MAFDFEKAEDEWGEEGIPMLVDIDPSLVPIAFNAKIHAGLIYLGPHTCKHHEHADGSVPIKVVILDFLSAEDRTYRIMIPLDSPLGAGLVSGTLAEAAIKRLQDIGD